MNAPNEQRSVAVHGYFVPIDPNFEADAPTLRDVWSALLARKWLVLGVAVGCAVLALVLAFFSAPVYKATAVVKLIDPTDRSGGLGGIAGQLGGLAALAGVKIPGAGDRSEPVAVLKSNEVAAEFIIRHQLLQELYPRKWNAQAKNWKRSAPSMPLAVKRFSRSMRDVVEDKATSLVHVSIRARDPERAAVLANDLIVLANNKLRHRAIEEAAKSLKFLEAEMQKTTNVQLQRAIAEMMQTQLNTSMLANVRSDYAVQVVDPAMAPDPEDLVWPRPVLLGIAGFIVGLLIGATTAIALQPRLATRLRARRGHKTADPGDAADEH